LRVKRRYTRARCTREVCPLQARRTEPWKPRLREPPSSATFEKAEVSMNTTEMVAFVILVLMVMVIAIVARRGQSVGLPPGADKNDREE